MKNLVKKIIGTLLSVAGITGAIISANTGFNMIKASSFTTTLNSNNSPVISAGAGTMVDDKGVTWEYSNVSDYNNGHITVNAQGYFGVSSSTTWGYTAINGITANFSTTDNELWLLTSFDGVDWNEQHVLESGVETHMADSWRYVRFYNWSDDNSSININIFKNCYRSKNTSSSHGPINVY